MYIIIFITASSIEEAEKIAQGLLGKKLVACVNIIDNLKSLFWWQGKIDHAKEVLLVAKSKKTKFTSIIRLVKSLHSYEVPEIIAIPLVAGEKKYLRWIDESLRQPL
ncbi:MAG: divalent-cation tolerance protein CutA [Candidatus Omnitrophota bacterium]